MMSIMIISNQFPLYDSSQSIYCFYTPLNLFYYYICIVFNQFVFPESTSIALCYCERVD